MKKENKLKELLNTESGAISGSSVVHEATNCIGTLNSVKGANIVMRNINVLKENSMAITQAINNRTPLEQMEPLVHSIVWATTRLNLNAVKEFSDLISRYLDPQIYNVVETSPIVDLEVIFLFYLS